MVVGKIVYEGIRFGARYFPKTIYQIKRADVRIHKSLYGASAGKGVRHGRDIGSIGAGIYQGTRQGDDLDGEVYEPRNGAPSNRYNKTRNRYQRYRANRRPVCYRPSRNKRYS